MNKAIIKDKQTGQPIVSGHYVYGSVQLKTGNRIKFHSCIVEDVLPGILGVKYNGEVFVFAEVEVYPHLTKIYPHITKVYLHKNKKQ